MIYFIAESSHSFDSTTLDSTLHKSAADAWTCIAIDYGSTYDDTDNVEILASQGDYLGSVTVDTGETFTVRVFDGDPGETGMATPDDARHYGWWPRVD